MELLTGDKRATRGSGAADGLDVRVDTTLPARIAIGAGNALFVAGSCFHRHQRIREVRVGLPGREAPVIAHGMPRPDLFRVLHPTVDAAAPVTSDPESKADPMLMSYRSGFWGIVALEPVAGPTATELVAAATLEDGTAVRTSLGRVELVPTSWETAVATFDGHAPEPLIAICMATYEPPLELFERQVESIRAQTHANWVCVISDDRSSESRFADIERVVRGDPRFVVSRAPRRLGHYHNFERALSMTPRNAAYATLADQDDRWHPEKLETLVSALGGARLVYSDARIVDRSGRVISDTYYSRRRNNYTNLTSLLIANTVTGAASLFPRDLLDLALPFPPRHGHPYHDHWLALVALATGSIAYVDRPLYDYVQHGGAAIGHARANAAHLELRTSLGRLRKLLREPRLTMAGWRGIYFWDVGRLLLFATVLERRCRDRMSAGKRRAVRRLITAERSMPLAAAWLTARRARKLTGHNETLGAEGAILRAITWRHAVAAIAGGQDRPLRRSRGNASLPPPPEQTPAARIDHLGTKTLAEKLRPLDLDVRDDAPERVNLLMPTIDLEHFFGGYIAKLNLARRLADRGLRVRLVTVDDNPPLPASWQRSVESYSGLEGVFDRLEVAFAREGGAIETSPADAFIATTWWTAHLAHRALDALSRERFLYLIQEYEPFTFPMGAFAALASQSYELPHHALFSTDLLRGYFRAHRLGVYADGEDAGDQASIAFANAITPVEAPSAAELADRRPRRLLFYARPEEHAARNMFELGMLALAGAVADGVLAADWELHGVGTLEAREPIDLGDGASLEMLPRRPQTSYGELLKSHDVGLALMYTPHPSLVPIEMASAGLLTVTNSFENKTPGAMAAISSNLITVEPSLEGLQAGIAEAVAGVDDGERRARGAAVSWSRDWDDSFNDEVIERVASWLEGR